MLNALLQSEWLIRMLDKSGKHASHKLLGLFNILDDLLSSPLSSQLQASLPASASQFPADRLQAYLTTQAQLAGARLPDMLANQLYFMALSACQEKLHHAQSSALQHARQAAQALIDEQTKREINWLAIRNYGIVIMALFSGTLGGYYWHMQVQPLPRVATIEPQEPPPHPLSLEASPMETAAIYGRLETMKHGDCRLIEAIQLPERLKSVYIENIINGHVSTNRDEQVLVNQLLDQVKCNYTPKLMANSKQ